LRFIYKNAQIISFFPQSIPKLPQLSTPLKNKNLPGCTML
jgi:hypothetical protein